MGLVGNPPGANPPPPGVIFARCEPVKQSIEQARALLERYGWKVIPPDICDDPL